MGLFLKILELTGRRDAARLEADRELAGLSDSLEQLRCCLDALTRQLQGPDTWDADYRRLTGAAHELRVLSRKLYRQSRRLERTVAALADSERAIRARLDRE